MADATIAGPGNFVRQGPWTASRGLGRLDVGEPRGIAVLSGHGLVGVVHCGHPISARVVAAVATDVGLAPSELAIGRYGGSAVPAGLRRVPDDPCRQSGFVASVAGRRETHGAGVLYGGNAIRGAAALRSVVRGWLSQLLLLGLFHSFGAGEVDGHTAGYGVQPGRPAAVRADDYRGWFPGVQLGCICPRPARCEPTPNGTFGQEALVDLDSWWGRAGGLRCCRYGDDRGQSGRCGATDSVSAGQVSGWGGGPVQFRFLAQQQGDPGS